MTNKRPGKIGYAGFRLRVIAIFPETAVQRIHIFFNACYSANWHTAANNFAVGAQVGFDAEHGLRAALVHTETADHLVKY